MYPNPTHGVFTLVADGLHNHHVSIILSDFSGKEIQYVDAESFPNGKVEEIIAISTLPAGIYTITLIQDDTVHSSKIIKQ